MKPMRFISLLLVVASALVLGISAGLIAGMNDVHQARSNPPPTQKAAEQKSPANDPKTVANTEAAPSYNDTAIPFEGKEYSPEDLTGADIAQVESMLESLGYSTTSGIVPAVQKYQQDNSLNATGALDINTLQSMVNQLKINRVKQLTNKTT